MNNFNKPIVIIPVLFALLINIPGFVFNWHVTIFFYDELAHFITPFCLTTLLMFYMMQSGKNLTIRPNYLFYLFVFCAILTVAALWEVTEYVYFSNIQSTYTMTLADTITDLVWGIAGTTAALITMRLVIRP